MDESGGWMDGTSRSKNCLQQSEINDFTSSSLEAMKAEEAATIMKNKRKTNPLLRLSILDKSKIY